MEKKENRPRFTSVFARALMLLVALLLVIYFVSVLTGSSDFFADSAEKNAKLYFEEDIARAEALADAHYSNLYEIVERLRYSGSRADVETFALSYRSLTVFVRRDALVFFENLGEVTAVPEAAFQRDRRDGALGTAEQKRRTLDAVKIHIIHR